MCIVSIAAMRAAGYPSAQISNGIVTARLYLPDAVNGSYRATRFDWSGIICSLRYRDHEYAGQWYAHHDPSIHDAITGPAEEFRTEDGGLGYAEAKPGQAFLRIGVGAVCKPAQIPYELFRTYEIIDPGKWTVNRAPDRIEFVHELHGPNGYAYVYTKTVRLTRGKPELVLEHRLRNTGVRTIDATPYNHNFFVIDNEVAGPDLRVQFSFPPKASADLKNIAEIRGNEIVYKRELQTGESVAADLTGWGANAKHYDFSIENRASGAGLRVRGDRPLSKLYFWSIRTVACPEPYIRLRVQPGRETRWRIAYQLYAQERE